MASSSPSSNPNNNNNNNLSSSVAGSLDQTTSTTNTTFVQADPTNFRAVVQRLTGATYDPTIQKLPVTSAARSSSKSGDLCPRRPAFKLQERRQGARNLEIKLLNNTFGSPSPRQNRTTMFSPVSPLDLFARESPRTPISPFQEEEKAIAQKTFYFHPTTPRGSGSASEPELLPLFPLHSPRDNNTNNLSPN